MKQLIAIVEDEIEQLEILEHNFLREGFCVEGFVNTHKVEELLKQESVDLIIMDRGLPNCDGVDFVRLIREKGYQNPVIFLSAKAEDEHKIEGLRAGGDDYVTKPFNMRELLFRVRAILNRTSPVKNTILQHRDITLDLDSVECFVNNRLVHLTKQEFILLSELMKQKNTILSRRTLLDTIWHNSSFQDRSVDVAMKRLKEKLDPEAKNKYIVSVRGVGYVMK